MKKLDLSLSDALFIENVLLRSEIKLKMLRLAYLTVNLIKILPKSVNRSYLLSPAYYTVIQSILRYSLTLLCKTLLLYKVKYTVTSFYKTAMFLALDELHRKNL